jgi:histone H4
MSGMGKGKRPRTKVVDRPPPIMPMGKRHKVKRDNALSAFNRGGLRRLARRGGVKRMSNLALNAMRQHGREVLHDWVNKAQILTEHRRHKTVTPKDVVYGIKKSNYGKNLYGFTV